MSSSATQPQASPPRVVLSRRAVGLVLVVEGVIAAIAAGVALRGTFGWALVVVAALFVPVFVAWRRGRLLRPVRVTDDPQLLQRLHVVGVTSRSSGDVGVVGDRQGYAAGLELTAASGARVDLGAVAADLAADPCHPSSVQLRITALAPPGTRTRGYGGRRRGTAVPVHRVVHLVVRFEPGRAGDVVESHGGGAAGSRAALVAALDRAASRLRRAGTPVRVLDTAAISAVLSDDTADVPARLLVADCTFAGDVQRLLDLLTGTAPQRSVLSLCVDLADADRWHTHAVVQVADPDAGLLASSVDVLRADDAIIGLAPRSAMASLVPLGGGPNDILSVLTLARQ
ncbi:Putative type VII ESX secretion system translocon, EccE [Jatrophihabitans endophyticus]|uniref:Putative type VII ESX secretion system translocon, EccE n=1 Tax=Jatrophihabitans endophyticus TaxID=1206085 RepID=A0A1M5HA16_9ACTN|nr:type VII secretion protein EccE [Jatrophihabitans endophyticus]SHG12763.1 Putative type VII ESX secretion system translocon, EccE [Jatrophihabitans endophyticus]